MKITVQSNAAAFAKLVQNLKKDIKEIVVPKGLDPILDKSLEELRDQLFYTINEEVRFEKKNENSDTIDTSPINIAQSDKTIIKYLGYDLDRVVPGSFSKDSYDAKVKYIQNYKKSTSNPDNIHCRVEVPAGSDESVEQVYEKALKNFQDSIYVDTRGFKIKYFILTEKGKNALRDYVKIHCSTRTGIQDGDALVKAGKRREREIKSGKDFSLWALKQEGLERLLNPSNGWSIEISDSVDAIKSGNTEDATSLLKTKNVDSPDWLTEKIEVLKKKNNITPDMDGYLALTELVRNLKISKKLEKNSAIYTLVSSYNEETIKDLESIFEAIKLQIKIWKIVNENVWVDNLVNVILKVIRKNLEGR